MKKKNLLSLLFILLFVPLVITSCDSDDDPTPLPEPELKTAGAYILNNGLMGYNNSTLDYYNPETGELDEKVFSSVNGRGLGDTANDLLIYGSKMYIAVNVSNTIEVTDLSGKEIKTLSPKNEKSQPQEPRFLVADKGKVYITMFDGYVAQLDTTSLEIEKQVEVGLGAEQLCIVDSKLYVAVSGHYTNPQSIVKEVNISTFTVSKELPVVVNPRWIKADKNGNLYVMSAGNYFDIPSTLQLVNPSTGASSVLHENDNISIAMADDYLYVLSSENDDAWLPVNTQYSKYNTNTAKFEEKPFVNSGVTIAYPTYLDVDPVSKDVYITGGVYTNTGDVYIISSEGSLVKKLEVSGNNPVCTRFLTVLE